MKLKEEDIWAVFDFQGKSVLKKDQCWEFFIVEENQFGGKQLLGFLLVPSRVHWQLGENEIG